MACSPNDALGRVIMRILLAGATGFIGRRLAELCMDVGHEVCAVARRADHHLPCRVIVAERPLDATSYAAAAAQAGSEIVINLLAAGVEPTDRDVGRLLAANAEFPARLASVLPQAGVKAMIHIGSSAEYAASPTATPLPETAPLERSRLYGATKAAGSILVQTTAKAAGLPVLVLRPFNIFGAGEKPHRLFPALARHLRRGEHVNLSEGTQIRDFLWVDDACNTILVAADALLNGTIEPGEYNLASGNATSVRDFVLTLANVANGDRTLLRFGAVPMRPDDLPYVVADTTKLDKAIGVASRTSLDQALMAALRNLDRGGSH